MPALGLRTYAGRAQSFLDPRHVLPPRLEPAAMSLRLRHERNSDRIRAMLQISNSALAIVYPWTLGCDTFRRGKLPASEDLSDAQSPPVRHSLRCAQASLAWGRPLRMGGGQRR